MWYIRTWTLFQLGQENINQIEKKYDVRFPFNVTHAKKYKKIHISSLKFRRSMRRALPSLLNDMWGRIGLHKKKVSA